MPLSSIIPLVAGVVGTGLQMAGNAQAQSAMNKARADEVAQQAALQNQSNAVFQKSLAGSTPATAAQQMGQGQAARTTAWQTLNNATQPVASALPATTDTATSGAQKRASSAANTWNELNANAAAKEGSYGDWENQQNIKNENAAQQLGVYNNFSAGDAALLPTELQVASTKGDALSGWGSIVSMLGRVAGAASAGGVFGGTSPQVSSVPVSAPQIVDGPSMSSNGWATLYS
jgi:hypothetical protein